MCEKLHQEYGHHDFGDMHLHVSDNSLTQVLRVCPEFSLSILQSVEAYSHTPKL